MIGVEIGLIFFDFFDDFLKFRLLEVHFPFLRQNIGFFLVLAPSGVRINVVPEIQAEKNGNQRKQDKEKLLMARPEVQ